MTRSRLARQLIILLLPLLCLRRAQAQADRVQQRMFLVGDAGELKGGAHPVCDWLSRHVDWNDTANTLVYLGDNVYPQGMPAIGSRDFGRAKAILDYQAGVVAGKRAKAFFVPGNHDWKQGRPGGWQQVRNEEAYIDSLQLPNVQLLPKGGCPGPIEVRVGEKMILVCMDSQWWLQPDDRPGIESGCDCKDETAVITALKDIVSSYPDKLIVLAMHHPMYTHGEHGGYYTLKQHIFPLTDLHAGLFIPLPVIGSIYPITRGVFGNIQDIRNPKYKDLRGRIGEVIQGHANVIHVAGHEHTLQLFHEDSVYYVVSGAGSKTTRVRKGRGSLFAREDLGFAVIEQYESGKSAIKFFTVDAKGLDEPAYTASLPALPLPVTDTMALARSFPDSVTVPGDKDLLAGGFKKILLGASYRREWAVPIRVKVLDLAGWTPQQRGGGHETRSLRLKDSSGVQYTLRGVKKYVTDQALPVALMGDAFVKDLVTDGVSASYPYAALSIPPFASALGVPHANPRLVYVPDDPRLGKYRSDFANVFCFLEEREPGNGHKTYNMTDLENKLREDNDNTIDQRHVLQARLLDMFVMDFDRHEDQWRWEAVDNGKGQTFSPVPRDRDQPFFSNQGLIPWIAGQDFVSPQLQGFRPKATSISTFNFNARNFDHNYMNELTEQQWKDAAVAVLAKMTDSLIDYALRLQPAAIQGYSMRGIISKLKERRKYFVAEMMDYYRFLARTVAVYGSDKRELFDIDRKKDGSVTITVYKITKDGKKGKQMYSRIFYGGQTKEVRLYGLGGDDLFHSHGEGGAILVRIIGGSGSDAFANEATTGGGRTKIYDLSSEKSEFTGNGAYRSYLSPDPSVNAVNKLGFKYNVLAPLLNFSYNPDDGIYLGVQFRYTTQGFHKDPYKQSHFLSLEHALATKAYAFKYDFEAIHAIGSADLLFHADIKAPDNTINFFGYGNESVYRKDTKEGVRFYRARFDSYDADLQFRKKIGSAISIAFGPAFQYFTVDSTDNRDRFINQANLSGLDHATLYQSRTYAGGRVTAIIDNRNDKILTSRGLNWQTQFSTYGGLNGESHPYSQLNTDLAVYTSFNTRARVVIANRIGYGRTFGQHEFYQSQFLGLLENLRGYRKFRFAGDESLYHNIDLRIKLSEFETYLFPGSFGILLFNDVGRVWQQGEQSRQWHDGYGGGFWISPLKKFVLSASYANGTDGGMTLIRLGFQY